MIEINLKSLINKMNPYTRSCLESAAGLCMNRGHYNVEIEHFLLKLLENNNTDIVTIFNQYKIDAASISTDLNNALEKLKTGNVRPPALSIEIIDLIKHAWVLASVEYNHNEITSAHITGALLIEEKIRRQITNSVRKLESISASVLKEQIPSFIGNSDESLKSTESQQTNTNSSANMGGTALDKYTINLTERAKAGEIDPVLGRDREIRQIIDILTRRRQNNPILTGEAGVGKTAVVEGFALRIATDDVPTPLKGVHIRVLDLGLLQAGASIKGEFENRLKSVIEEVKASPVPIILFIDEAHTMIGAGGKEGQGDAANLLKPALARGELRTIAATTWAEYKKYFERDPALTRRFQVVKVEEPDEETAIDMMRAIAKSLQSHHNVHILDDAIIESVRLSTRYMPGRQLPDKSVSLLDTACARVALSQSTTPAKIEDLARRIKQCISNIDSLEKENLLGGNSVDALKTLYENQSRYQDELDTLKTQWQQEKSLINQIKEIRKTLEQDYSQQKFDSENKDILSEEERSQLQSDLSHLADELISIQAESALMQPSVDKQAIAEVIANWTGIPVGKMVSNEINSIIDLASSLERRVIGQSHALDMIAKSIQTSRAGLTDPRKPIGVFLMVGPSGVGKTETAMALADILYGGEHNITVINMSEFKEEHKVSMLLGSPPGYVGYGEGGVLTEAIRRNPYSIILLDEMEKAHPGVQDVFYQMFDKGTIKDGEGRDIDCRNTVIIMTSNAGEEVIRHICETHEETPDYEALLEMFRPVLLKQFKPAFLGRTQVIPYYPLSDEILVNICELNMKHIENRVSSNYGAAFSYNPEVPIHIVARSQEVDTGARNIENIISKTLLPELATECLGKMSMDETINTVHIDVSDDGTFSYSVS